MVEVSECCNPNSYYKNRSGWSYHATSAIPERLRGFPEIDGAVPAEDAGVRLCLFSGSAIR